MTRIAIYGCRPDEAVAFRAAAARFGVAVTFAELSTPVAGYRCASVGHHARITNSALRALSRAGVRYLSTRSVGVDHIDADYAASVGITVGNVAYSPDSVADYTLMLMLMVLRNANDVLRRASLHDYRLGGVRGKELRDLTVGVVGTGRIGRAVIDRLRGFGCRILTTPPLDDLLRQSDLVTLHTPLNDDTRHLLNGRRIERMKPGAVVVNTGRGPLIDTEALVAALESGRLGGAALDVIEGEEGVFYADCRGRPIDNKALPRLEKLPNVIISPHTAFYTDHALNDVVENTIANCLEFEKEKVA
jgi:D-specific alpha-keto acid dehydrogenase